MEEQKEKMKQVEQIRFDEICRLRFEVEKNKNLDKVKLRELRKELKSTELNRVQDHHNFGKIDLDCCQQHRDLYDKNYEKIEDYLQDISEDEAESPEPINDTTTEPDSVRTSNQSKSF